MKKKNQNWRALKRGDFIAPQFIPKWPHTPPECSWNRNQNPAPTHGDALVHTAHPDHTRVPSTHHGSHPRQGNFLTGRGACLRAAHRVKRAWLLARLRVHRIPESPVFTWFQPITGTQLLLQSTFSWDPCWNRALRKAAQEYSRAQGQ